MVDEKLYQTPGKVNEILHQKYGNCLAGFLYDLDNRETVIRTYRTLCGLNESEAVGEFEDLLIDAQETLGRRAPSAFSRSVCGSRHAVPKNFRT